jgi:hypothetical protein
MPARQALILLLSADLLIAACSDDDASPTTSRQSVASLATSTTTSTTSIGASTTSSTAPPTTEATTTTTLPIEEQVRAAMLGYYEVYWRCLRSPGDCDPLEVVVPDSDAYRALTATRNDLVKGGY